MSIYVLPHPQAPPHSDGAPFAFHPNILQCFICREPPTEPISTSCSGDVFCCLACTNCSRTDPSHAPSADSPYNETSTSFLCTAREPQATADPARAPTSPARLPTLSISHPVHAIRSYLLQTQRQPQPNPHNSGSENLTSASFVLTPSSVLTAYERSIHQLSESLETEREHVMRLGINNIDLELEVSDLEQQHAELFRAVRDREWVLEKERDEVVQSGHRVRALEERNGRLASEAAEGRERVTDRNQFPC